MAQPLQSTAFPEHFYNLTEGYAQLPAHVDILDLRVAEDFVKTFLLADAALFPAAIRRSDIAAAGIDPHIARFDALGGFHRLGEIVSDDGRRQSVFDAVDFAEHVLVVVPRHYRHD